MKTTYLSESSDRDGSGNSARGQALDPAQVITVTRPSETPLFRAVLRSPTKRVLITGGSGFLGFRLATVLVSEGVEVILLDLSAPRQPLPPGAHFVAGSVVDAAAIDAAVCTSRGPVDAVFHVASYGMSGRELRDHARIEAVNVCGTRNIVETCLRRGVPRLVYVSTCNVIFVGRPITGGDESAPYPPATAYKDAYSATKAQAERLVREANGRPLEGFRRCQSGGVQGRQESGRQSEENGRQQGSTGGEQQQKSGSRDCDQPVEEKGVGSPDSGWGGRLATCCIRSTGIWGPGETRHQPRVIRMVQAGLFGATFGDPASRSDWIHVDNLVQMLILAERALRLPTSANPAPKAAPDVTDGSGDCRDGESAAAPVAAGQVYYASDGDPINNFLHFKPFIVGLGYNYPSLNVPYTLVYGIATLIEYTWPLLQYLVSDPPLTRMEVDKCCIEHWFDIRRARQDLGYRPAAYDREEVVRHMAVEGWSAAATAAARGQRSTQFTWLLLAAVVVSVVLAVAAHTGGRGDVGEV